MAGAVPVLIHLFLRIRKDIEIYKFGATAWPRTIILLMAIAALGQLFHHWKRGDETSSEIIDAATDDGSEEAAHDAHHEDIKWYASTFGLLLIPFAYMHIPDWIVGWISAEGTMVHIIRVICALILIGIFIYLHAPQPGRRYFDLTPVFLPQCSKTWAFTRWRRFSSSASCSCLASGDPNQ